MGWRHKVNYILRGKVLWQRFLFIHLSETIFKKVYSFEEESLSERQRRMDKAIFKITNKNSKFGF